MIKDIIAYPEGPVDAIFMVKAATVATSNSGSPYLSLTLQDISGSIDAKMWSITDADIEICQPGTLVMIHAMASIYRGHPQLKVMDVTSVNTDTVDLSRFIPTAPKPQEEMVEEMNSYLSLIKDTEIKSLTESLIRKSYQDYISFPAAVTVHHAYLGGLLYHSLSICAMAIAIQKHYPELNLDYLVAGSLLHDLGKTKELSSSITASYTPEGKLIGHIVLGAMMIHEEAGKLSVNEEKKMVLIHMILAHHGEYEFGSPKLPATREALVLHSLDDLDAKMECLKNAYELTSEGDFTQKIQWMENGIYYKPFPTGDKKSED